MEDSGLLRGYETRMLRTPEALAEFLRECGEISCHTDPVLRWNVRASSKFVRKMHGVGLVDCSLRCECELGVFFVHKKSGCKIRLILDCRRATARFRAPPRTELLSSEGFSNIEFDDTGCGKTNLEELRLHLGVGDVTDCFHRVRLKGSIRRFFCCRPSRPPDWASKKSGGNTPNPSRKCGQWPTAFLRGGAGACTLR